MEWSKSIYSYGMAVCLLEIGGEDVEMRKEAAHLMGQVPSLRQKIAGKSIPLEVCHASYHLRMLILSFLAVFTEICSSQSPQVPKAKQSPRSPGP